MSQRPLRRILALHSAMARRLVALALAAVAIACACPDFAGARVGGALVPLSGALMGAYVNPANSYTLSTSDHENLVTQFESTVGRKLDIEMWYYRWGNAFWSGAPAWDLAHGRIPLVKYGAADVPTLTSIVNGSQDATLRALADGAKSLGKQFFFCPFWEMNGDWESWNGSHYNDSGTYDGPLLYIKAWKHMHDIFVQRGATNAVWVWAPDKGDSPKENWNHWLKYYPGDDYVNWVGFDGYNWGIDGSSWSSYWISFEDTFLPIYRDFAGRKPMMIAETASAEAGGDKAQWIADAEAAIKARWPDLDAFVWFDVNKLTETDWRVNSSTGALAAYKSWLQDPYFNVKASGTAPSSRALPTVSGRPKEGQTLSGANGTWAGFPTSFAYQWKRCGGNAGACVAVSGATALTYTATSSDVGSTLRLFVTAKNGSGTAVVASDATFVIAARGAGAPSVVQRPYMMGASEQGSTLVARAGTWTGAPTSFSYQWSRCDSTGSACATIGGITGPSYVLSSSDVGSKLKVAVVAANSAGSTAYTVTSRLVYGLAPVSTSSPSISGTAAVGAVLTAARGGWSGSPTSYLYRWRRCGSTGGNCIDISGATTSSYKVTSADVGFTIRLDVIASNRWGSTLARSSATARVV
jgi:Glycosyl hydrolase family 26